MSFFKTIVFFSVTREETVALRTHLSALSTVKVFNTTTVGEIQQIVEMSTKSAIFCDSFESLEIFKNTEFRGKKVLYRKYFLDLDCTLSNADCNRIGESNVTVLRSNSPKAIFNKVELYLFGKLNVFKRDDYNHDKEDTPSDGMYRKFFTLLEYGEQGWHIVVSSHEKEDNIGNIIGKNWEALVETIIETAPTITKTLEGSSSDSSYYEIVTPHIKNGKTEKITIIHLIKSPDLKQNIFKVKSFLHGL